MRFILKDLFISSWKKFIKNSIGFRIYNKIQESNLLPYQILELFVRLNRYATIDAIGKNNSYIRLFGNNRKLTLPSISKESHWQFLQSYRWHDPYYSNLIRIFLVNERVGSFIDIGANQGLRSLDAFNFGWRVEAIEPNMNAINFLKEIAEKNSFIKSNDLRIHYCCAGNERQMTELFVDESSYLSQVKDIYDERRFDNYTVIESSVVKLKDLIEKYCIDISSSVCKIDTEGYEIEVLKGFEEYISLINIFFVELSKSNVDRFVEIIPVDSECYWIDAEHKKLKNIRDIRPENQIDAIIINRLSSSSFLLLSNYLDENQIDKLKSMII